MSNEHLNPRDSCKTAVKIRGKRTATAEEKWRVGKRRRSMLSKRPIADGSSPLMDGNALDAEAANAPRKRQRMIHQLSRLEKLPTEILQQIFIMSGNPDLAFCCSNVAARLSSGQLHHLMAMHLLLPILNAVQNSRKLEDSTLSAAMRLLNARFLNLNWLRTWLKQAIFKMNGTLHVSATNADARWIKVVSSLDMLPPKKLFKGPFTSDKIEFLGFYVGSTSPITRHTLYTELAYEGLSEAIKEGKLAAVRNFLLMGLQPNTEHLRLAIMNNECRLSIVEELISKNRESATSNEPDFDLLDQDIWTWIKRAQAQDNEKGIMLMRILQAAHDLLLVRSLRTIDS